MYRYTLVALLFSSLAAAQEFRGTVLGRLTDPTGAVVPRAGLDVKNAETGASFKTTSNESGNYQVPFLLPGNYTIRVEAPGFKAVERSGIRVSTGGLVTVDFQLEVGVTSDSITVAADPPLLDTASADLGQVVTREFVQTLEFSTDRNIASLALLAPGVNGNDGGTYTAATHANISINGGGGTRGDNEYLVDGIPNTTAGGAPVFLPAIDAVDEFKVHTTMFDASMGHTNGGVISLTTRGGTNELHGTGYWYARRTSLMANGWTNNRAGNPRPPVKYDQFGYLVGGPVYIPRFYDGRNRTFFSNSLERDNDNRNLTPQFRVPTAAERQGDFSQTLNRLGGPLTIFDPATTVVTGANTVTRQPFAGNRIPAARITPIGSALMKLFPEPTLNVPAQVARQNWTPGGYYNVKQRNMMIRGDHIISDNQRVFARFGRARRLNAPGQIFYPSYRGGNVGFGDTAYTNFGLDDTVTFSPRLVGTIRLGIVRRAGGNKIGAAGLDPKELNLPDIIVRNQFYQGYPQIAMGESFPNTGSNRSFDASDMYSLVGTFTKLAGSWSLKFGFDYRVQRWNTLSPGENSFGSFTFNNTFTRSDPFRAAAADTSGTSMASLLLAAPASGELGYSSTLASQNQAIALYSQNDWKITPRLTLNLGLRWELETPFTERFNRQSYGFDENARLPVNVPGYNLRGGILFAGVDENPRRGGPLDTNNFGPRFGFAYQLNPKTVVRGGYGVFYSVISNNTTFRSGVNTFNAVTSYRGTNDGGATIFTTLANPFPSGLRTPVGSSAGLMASVGDGLSFFDDKRVSPYNQQWQFNIQRELPLRTVVEAAYVGMLSLKGVESFNLNEKSDIYLPLGAAENTSVFNPFYGYFPETSSIGGTDRITQGALWRRFPQFTSLNIEGANTKRTVYHAFQAKVDKRLSHGFNLILAYTRSRIMDNNMSSLVNERHWRSVSEFDQKHALRMAFVYELPSRWGNRFLDRSLGGWKLSGHYKYITGAPLSVSHANGRPIRLRSPKLGGSAADRIGDKVVNGVVQNPFFDINAFAPLPTQYMVTPEPPSLDDLRGPKQDFIFLQLFKSFPIRERFKVEFSIEADNATNTPQWDNPGTNMSNRATFGVITSAGDARTIQTSVRVRF